MKKIELKIANSKKFKQIHSNKSLKRIKRFIMFKDIKRQTKETIEELEIKRRKRNYLMHLSKFKSDKRLEISKLGKLNSPKFPRKNGTKNELINSYQCYESKIIRYHRCHGRDR